MANSPFLRKNNKHKLGTETLRLKKLENKTPENKHQKKFVTYRV